MTPTTRLAATAVAVAAVVVAILTWWPAGLPTGSTGGSNTPSASPTPDETSASSSAAPAVEPSRHQCWEQPAGVRADPVHPSPRAAVAAQADVFDDLQPPDDDPTMTRIIEGFALVEASGDFVERDKHHAGANGLLEAWVDLDGDQVDDFMILVLHDQDTGYGVATWSIAVQCSSPGPPETPLTNEDPGEAAATANVRAPSQTGDLPSTGTGPEALQRDLLAIIEAAGFEPHGGDHDIGQVATSTVEADGELVELRLEPVESAMALSTVEETELLAGRSLRHGLFDTEGVDRRATQVECGNGILTVMGAPRSEIRRAVARDLARAADCGS